MIPVLGIGYCSLGAPRKSATQETEKKNKLKHRAGFLNVVLYTLKFRYMVWLLKIFILSLESTNDIIKSI